MTGDQYKGIIYLTYNSNDSTRLTDSTQVENQHFQFKGVVLAPTEAVLYIKGKENVYNPKNIATLWLENNILTLALNAKDFQDFKMTGSKSNNEAAIYKKHLNTILLDPNFKKLGKDYGNANQAHQKGIDDNLPKAEQIKLQNKVEDIGHQLESYYVNIAKINRDYVLNHPNSYVSASIITGMTYAKPYDTLMKYYNYLSDNFKKTSTAKSLLVKINKTKKGTKGSIAKQFTSTDINGNTLSLADYFGKKYVLLDFWASWCVPCRQGNPHLIELYNKYKDRGFEIIGVADDNNTPEAWKKAVKTDNIGIWKHILRGNKDLDLSESYGIHALPTKVLINKEGVIVDVYNYEREKELDDKLAELLGK